MIILKPLGAEFFQAAGVGESQRHDVGGRDGAQAAVAAGMFAERSLLVGEAELRRPGEDTFKE